MPLPDRLPGPRHQRRAAWSAGALALAVAVPGAGAAELAPDPGYTITAKYAVSLGDDVRGGNEVGRGTLVLYKNRRWLFSARSIMRCERSGYPDPADNGVHEVLADVGFSGRMRAGARRISFMKVTERSFPTGDGRPDATSSRAERLTVRLSANRRTLDGSFDRTDETTTPGDPSLGVSETQETCGFRTPNNLFTGTRRRLR